MRQHMDGGIAPVDQVAVFPDLSVAVVHGHDPAPQIIEKLQF